MAPFHSRRREREQLERSVLVTAIAVGLHALVLSVLTPPTVDPEALARLRVDSNLNLDDSLAEDGRLVEMDDALVDLDCQSGVTVRTLVKLGRCRLFDDSNTCRDRAYSFYRIESVSCREPLDGPELAELTPTPLFEADVIELPPLDQLIDPPTPEQEVEVDDPDDPDARGQVVEIAKPSLEARPEDAKLLAEYDSKVEKETIKRGSRTNAPPSAPPSKAPPVEQQAPQTAVAATPPPGSAGAPGAMSMRAEKPDPAEAGRADGVDVSGTGGILSPFGLPEISSLAEPNQPVGRGGENGAGGTAAGPQLSPRSLVPSAEAINRAVQSGSDDYLPGIDEGEGTALNAKRWKYASFFNRVKGQVRQNWNPARAYRLRDPNGNIYGSKDRLTVVTVSLKPDGKLNKVWVVEPCGVDFLDDEAVLAFERAAPFPNPPKALVDGDSNLITFRFGFMFAIDNRAAWKVFRYRN